MKIQHIFLGAFLAISFKILDAFFKFNAPVHVNLHSPKPGHMAEIRLGWV